MRTSRVAYDPSGLRPPPHFVGRKDFVYRVTHLS